MTRNRKPKPKDISRESKVVTRRLSVWLFHEPPRATTTRAYDESWTVMMRLHRPTPAEPARNGIPAMPARDMVSTILCRECDNADEAKLTYERWCSALAMSDEERG